jgi:hypothetical protein
MAIHVPDKWNVPSSLKTVLSRNKLSSSRRFSISVRKSLWCGRSLGCNSFRSWSLYSRNLLRSTVHTVTWETSPNSLLARLVGFCGLRRNVARTRSSLVTWSSARFLLSKNATRFSKRLVPHVNGFYRKRFFTNIRTKPALNQCRWMVLFELQHTPRFLQLGNVRHFDGRLQRTNQWWPRVLGFKWRKTFKCSQTFCNKVCCGISIRLDTINFQSGTPYYVTFCMLFWSSVVL